MGNYVRRCQLDHMIAYSRAAQIRYKMVEIAIKSDSKKRLHICYCIQKQMCDGFFETDVSKINDCEKERVSSTF